MTLAQQTSNMEMEMRNLVLSAVLAAAPCWALAADGGSSADTFAGRPEARIQNAGDGGITQFAVTRSGAGETFYVEDRFGEWYRVSFETACDGAADATLMVFKGSAAGTLDRNGEIWMERKRCAVESIVALTHDEAVDRGLPASPMRAARVMAQSR
jgi:hypothetical protein